MKANRLTQLAFAGCFILLCSQAMADTNSLPLPPEVPMSKDAGRGKLLVINLQLEGGETVPLLVDTGTGRSCFDLSFEPKLGKRLADVKISHWGKTDEGGIYAAPKLYLGDVPLKTSPKVFVTYLKRLSHPDSPVMGILGLDCLSNYCIQLDFQAGKVRFFDSEHADKSGWGKAFPIIARSDTDPRPTIPANLVGVKGPRSMLDSGCSYDGWLAPALYRQWTNKVEMAKDGEVRSPKGVLAGEIYPDVRLRKHPDSQVPEDDAERNGIGISFMARHLVTFDFPHQTLYLQRTSTGRLRNDDVEKTIAYFKKQLAKDRLPGLSPRTDADYTAHVNTAKDSANFEVKADGFLYHYEFARAGAKHPWKLKKAWRTDKDNHVKEYPVYESTTEE